MVEPKEEIQENPPSIDLKLLTLIIFLIVCANFILGVVIIYPFFGRGNIHPNLNNTFMLSFSFIYYLLLLSFLDHYVRVITYKYRKNRVKFILRAMFIGLVILAVISYLSWGMLSTLSWVIPTVVTIILFLIGRMIDKKNIFK